MRQSSDIQIFLAHASGDKATVLELYKKLKAKGYNPWLDKKNLIPGQNWREAIPQAIKESDFVIACLSKKSVTKQGYIQHELRMALVEYAQKPANSVYLIPLRLEPCDIPDMQLPQLGISLRNFHWLDYWEPDGFEILVRAIEHRFFHSPHPAQTRNRKLVPSESQTYPPISTPADADIGRRRFLSALAFGGVGATGALLWEVLRNRRLLLPKDPSPSLILTEPFTFTVVKVDTRGNKIDQRERSVEYFSEDLGSDVTLDMVSIPSGSFKMGSPESEAKREISEEPQHRVEVPQFFMGRYPVTQAQWQAVAVLEKVNRELNTHPSIVKGEQLPIENVSWFDAMEFCDRISRKTRRQYHLPSEAEWEYACRAGTVTPFHFGPTITTDLANYDGTSTYNFGPQGQRHSGTTAVGSFKIANAFGLYDMHGNVLEWCLDDWHDNYEGALNDGKARLENNKANSHSQKLLRGGCWNLTPRYCRSASRLSFQADFRGSIVGFRLVCSAVRT